ncbi:RDD family protein [Porticoccus sp. W117]|uniref:RDD family protein n=1 Tax=Porticoccus sp. W117 TaxID=3054777 RepID=UPI0025998E8D|nr:RDD family protein [Porticoccus sp. W117]MDM3870165.1 RDD family protein [Porticoccus sp. W117]
MEEKENIYKAPEAELVDEGALVSGGVELASRWSRLAASILDSIILIALVFVIVFVASSFGGDWVLTAFEEESLINNIIAVLIGMACWMGCNFYLMKTKGQTIGKLALKIQVVDFESSKILKPSQSVGIRFFIPQTIGALFNFFLVVDALFIFRQDKRCVHDLMAKTKVVQYQPPAVD